MNSGETEQEIVVARRSDQRKNIFCLETYSWFKRFDHRLEMVCYTANGGSFFGLSWLLRRTYWGRPWR